MEVKVFTGDVFDLQREIQSWMETQVGTNIAILSTSTSLAVEQERRQLLGAHVVYYMPEETVMVTCSACKGQKRISSRPDDPCYKCQGTGEMPVPKSLAGKYTQPQQQ